MHEYSLESIFVIGKKVRNCYYVIHSYIRQVFMVNHREQKNKILEHIAVEEL